MINISLYLKNREKFKTGVFNPADFDQSELAIICANRKFLNNPKFCGEAFRDGALAYLRDHASEFIDEILYFLPSVVDSIVEKNHLKLIHLMHEYDNFEDAIESLREDETIHESALQDMCEDLNNSKFIFRLSKEDKATILDMAEFFSEAVNLPTYWAHCILAYFCFIAGSIDNSYKLLINSKPQKTFDLFFEQFDNLGWDDSVDELMNLSKEEQKFWSKIIEHFDIAGFRLANELSCDSRVREYIKNYKLASPDYHGVRIDPILEWGSEALSHIREIGFDSLSREELAVMMEDINRIANTEYDILDSVELDQARLKDLIKQYKMPTNVAEKLKVFAESEDFGKGGDLLRPKLAKVFDREEGGSLLSDLNERFGGNKVVLRFHAKNDPTAIFAGKMTGCCQYFTGDSSSAAVEPVYTDPNAGLITISRSNGRAVVGAFAWLAKDQKGNEGIVLDSLEFMQASYAEKLANIISEFSTKLNHSGLKLWIGNGGKTPKFYNKDTEKALSVITRPTPVSEDFKPYYDSANVYEIEPGISFTAKHKNDDTKYTRKILEGKSESEIFEIAEKIQDLGKESFEKIAKIAFKSSRTIDEVCSELTESGISPEYASRLEDSSDWFFSTPEEKFNMLKVYNNNIFSTVKNINYGDISKFIESQIIPFLISKGFAKEEEAEAIISIIKKISNPAMIFNCLEEGSSFIKKSNLFDEINSDSSKTHYTLVRMGNEISSMEIGTLSKILIKTKNPIDIPSLTASIGTIIAIEPGAKISFGSIKIKGTDTALAGTTIVNSTDDIQYFLMSSENFIELSKDSDLINKDTPLSVSLDQEEDAAAVTWRGGAEESSKEPDDADIENDEDSDDDEYEENDSPATESDYGTAAGGGGCAGNTDIPPMGDTVLSFE